jgi:BlaI family transcriptional regulator, penicillinase repressor
MKKDLDSIILTRQELQIIKVVWERGAATVREVCDVISQTKPTAYTTVLTLMGILEDKGALTHVRSGRAYIYKPLLSRRQATKNVIHDLVTRFFEGKPENMVESVLENEPLNVGQLAALRSLLESRVENQVA